jgi:hypothetical protein
MLLLARSDVGLIILGLFGALFIAFWIWMLIECAVYESSEGNIKATWILIILVGDWIAEHCFTCSLGGPGVKPRWVGKQSIEGYTSQAHSRCMNSWKECIRQPPRTSASAGGSLGLSTVMTPAGPR